MKRRNKMRHGIGFMLAAVMALSVASQPATAFAEEVTEPFALEETVEAEAVEEATAPTALEETVEAEMAEGAAELFALEEPAETGMIEDEREASVYEEDPEELLFLQAADTSVSVSTQTELEDALRRAGSSGEETIISLTSDISISGTANVTNQLVVPAGANVVLQSKGGKQFSLIEQTAFGYDSSGAKHGLIVDNGNLTLKNITLDSNGKGRGVVVNNSAVLTLESGAILKNGAENFNSGDGLGVYVVAASRKEKGGILYIRDGAQIIDNTAEGNGGASGAATGIGVFVGDYGTMIMTGGQISNNRCTGVGNSGVFASSYAQKGGGLAAKYAEVEISGGQISDNVSLDAGGGIYIEHANVVLKGDAKIENNQVCLAELSDYSDGYGGGIYIYNGSLTIEENASISNNIACTTRSARFAGCGGAIFINNGTVTMNGGVLSGNTAKFDDAAFSGEGATARERYDVFLEGCGGGVFIEGGTFAQAGGLITQNHAVSTRATSEAQGHGGGIYLGFTNGNGGTTNPETKGHFRFYGGSVTGNTVTGLGKDIYVADRLATETSTIGAGASATSILGEVAGTPDFWVSGAPVVGELYLPEPAECILGSTASSGYARAQITGPLSEAADLSFITEIAQAGFVVGQSGEGYPLLNSDAARFHYLGEQLTCGLNAAGQIVLEESTEGKTDLSSAEVSIADATYTGEAVEPALSVTLEGTKLEEGVDYTATFRDNLAAGTAGVTINGIRAYTGTITKSFAVQPASLTEQEIAIAQIPDGYYTGQPVEASVRISFHEETLEQDADYTLRYENNTETGTAFVYVTGTGNFTGTKKLEYRILKSDGFLIISDAQELRTQLLQSRGSLTAPVNLLLAADIALDAPLATGQNTFVSLYGNGHQISMEKNAFATEADPAASMLQVLGTSEVALSNVRFDGKFNARILYVGKAAAVTADPFVSLFRGAAANEIKPDFAGQILFNEGTVVFDGNAGNTKSVNRGYGGFYNAGTLTLKEHSRVSNILTCFGGAIYNETGAELLLQGGTISSCSTNAKAAFGTGITNCGSLKIEAGTIRKNTGPGAAIYNKGSVLMSGGTIEENVNTIATWGVGARTHGISGGGVFQNQGSFVMTGGEITGNTAVEGGGVLVIGGNFTMNGAEAKLKGNHAKDAITSGTNANGFNFGNGGGVFINGGTFELLAGQILRNDASFTGVEGRQKVYSGYGSAIFMNGGTVRLAGGLISGNEGTEAYGSSNAIYYGNSAGIDYTEDDSRYPGELIVMPSNEKAALELSGEPVIEDDIFVKKDNVISLTGTLGNIAVPIAFKQLNPGNPIARYVSSAEVSAEDGTKFVSDNYSFIVNETEKTIVAGADLSDCEIRISDAAYTGAEIIPEVKVIDRKGRELSGFTRTVLSEDKINAGEKTIQIKGDGFSVRGEVTGTFRVTKRELAGDMIVLEQTAFDVTGAAIEPKVTVKITRNTTAKDEEYQVSYADNVEVGTATVIVTATDEGNLSGQAVGSFEIQKPAQEITTAKTAYTLPATSEDFSLDAVSKEGGRLSYTSSHPEIAAVNASGQVHILSAGKTVLSITADETEAYRQTTRNVSLTVTRAGQIIQATQSRWIIDTAQKPFSLGAATTGDGALSYASSDETVAVVDETGRVTVTGAGEAELTITASETAIYRQATSTVTVVVDKAMQDISVKAASKDNVIKKVYGSKAFSLGARADGKLTYKSSAKKVATVNAAGKVTIKGCGVAKITVTAAGTDQCKKTVRTLSLQVTPKKMKIKAAANTGAKTAVVNWAKETKATGYQIRYSTGSNMKNAVVKTVTNNKKTSLKLTGLKTGKKYYIQIRAYCLVDKKTGSALFGSWSAKKRWQSKNRFSRG